MPTKTPTSIRLSDDAQHLRDVLAESLGVSKAAVVELAIRELAKKHGLRGGKAG
jgi:predicted transcriptional regulator